MKMNVFEFICNYLRRYALETQSLYVRRIDIFNEVCSYVSSKNRRINESTVGVYLSILKKAGYISIPRRGLVKIDCVPDIDLTYSTARMLATEVVDLTYSAEAMDVTYNTSQNIQRLSMRGLRQEREDKEEDSELKLVKTALEKIINENKKEEPNLFFKEEEFEV